MIQSARQTASNDGLTGVISAVEELIAVIEAENALLARGMPASLSRSTERKSSLAAILAAALAGAEARSAVTNGHNRQTHMFCNG